MQHRMELEEAKWKKVSQIIWTALYANKYDFFSDDMWIMNEETFADQT
jgi:hypothetical protein